MARSAALPAEASPAEPSSSGATSAMPAVFPSAPSAACSAPAANGAASGPVEIGSPIDAVVHRLHFTRPDGRACFDVATAAKANFTLPAEAARDPELRALARRAAGRDGKPASGFKGLPKPIASYHSEARQSSLLRTDWSAGGAQLAVDWSSPELQLEFYVGRDLVFAGRSAPEVRVDGTLRAPIGDWIEVVWLSDVDSDFLELEIELTGGVWLQRQFLLTRRDGWLYTADVVLLHDLPGAHDIDARLALPCVDKARFTPAAETCEASLVVGRRQLAVIPPGLPEWRSANREGSLTTENGATAIAMSARQVRALYVPLAVQFDGARARKPLTWRQLTVGENLTIVPAERAVGYRLQLGREHWLVYRSLTPRANRTVLGVNLQTDFLFSRFTAEGESEPLVEIEA
jgi:hypothetical protein